MIPKLKPYYNKEELKLFFTYNNESIIKFEQKFAKHFNSKFGLAFTSGRAGLYAFLKSQKLSNAEVLTPAYNCIVVQNAIVISGNIPTFSDISTRDYNSSADLLKKAITPKTKAIIPTHMYGYPVDISPILDSVGEGVYIIQDCCLGLGTTVKGKYVATQGDIAMYSFGIGKQISTLDGGMITTDNEEIYEKLRNFRDQNLIKPRISSRIFKRLYLPASFVITNNNVYNFIYLLWKNTKILHPYTQTWSLNNIYLPKNHNEHYTKFQAKIGLVQIKKIDEILEKREKIVKYYNKTLSGIKTIKLPPIIKGATYSHYVPMVNGRTDFLKKMASKGIHVGLNFDYSVPHTTAYKNYANQKEYENSLICANKIVNLPNYPSLTKEEQDHIINSTIESLS